jgi:hypothetical protein
VGYRVTSAQHRDNRYSIWCCADAIVSHCISLRLSVRPCHRIRLLYVVCSEIDGASQVCCRLDGANSIVLHPPTNRTSRRSALTQAVRAESSVVEKQVFAFDYTYGDASATSGVIDDRNSQERVFADLGAIVLENAFAGFNCSLLAYGQTGAGKCWATGTRLMMHDGTSRPVESIQAGDRLMGCSDDGISQEPVVVIPGSLNRGHTTLYEIISANEGRAPWRCNADHILVLQWTVRPSVVRPYRRRAGWTFSILTERHGQIVMRQRSFDTKEEAETARELALSTWAPLVREYAVQDFLQLEESVQQTAEMFQPDLVHFAPPALPLKARMEATWQRKMSEEQILATGQRAHL